MTALIYFPESQEIANITNSYMAVVTTTQPHGYRDGIFITVVIPYPGVMPEIAGKTFATVLINATDIGLLDMQTNQPVNTTNSTAFSLGPFVTVYPNKPPFPVPAPFQVREQVPQVIPAGEIGTTLENAQNVIGPRNPP